MLVRLYFFIITCVISSVCTDRPCENWKHHRNFHLVHYEEDCGKEIWIRWKGDEISSRILNGLKPAPGSFPWMAYVSIKSGEVEYQCGGTIINDKYVLTAAHCVKFPNCTATVVVGLYDVKDIRSNLYGYDHAYKVWSITRHREYQKLPSGRIRNDIALLRLERQITFDTPYVNYICLPATCDYVTKEFLGENLLMAGWGETTTNNDATTLQKAELKVQKCGAVPEDDSHMCSKTRTQKTCLGDSGGPLMHLTTSRVYQIGILSTGEGECTADQLKTSVFTKVPYFMSWILDHINP